MRRSMRWCALVAGLLALSSDVQAGWFKRRPAAPPAVAPSGRTVVPLDHATIQKHFPGKSAVEINTALRGGRWRPDAAWLQSTGKRYGRLLVVSDLHPSTGQDPVTRKVNPAEDFKPNLQEPDFHNMMRTQWQEAGRDGKVRTLVLNGDTLEFMQTTRAPAGRAFHSDGSDAYGPANTPANVAAKLDAIYAGHPTLFGTYAEHLARGHRLVFVPGNHDRQMLHPTVRKVLVRNLGKDVARRLLADSTFHASAGKHKRRQLADLEARRLVKDRLEFHPWFFMVGDVVARHGHETDKYNAFSTPFGEYYHPGPRQAPIEAALGDYIVKGVFNKVERRKPWTDNTSRTREVVKAVVQASDFNPVKAFTFLRWLLTREGSPTDRRALARGEERKVQDVRRYVREFGLLEKFNAIRPADSKIGEEQLVARLLTYEGLAARPALGVFGKKHGALRRLASLVRWIPAVVAGVKSSTRERQMSDLLFGDLHISTLTVGHDHAFRADPRLVIDEKRGTRTRATVLDTSTWTDQLPEIRRDVGFVPSDNRGVLVVDFDAKGSHPVLMNYDASRGLQKVMVLESEAEARNQTAYRESAGR